MPLVVTLLMLIAPVINPYIVGIVVILLSIILYTIHKTHYLAISVAILALLYGIGFIPVIAFLGPLMMMVWRISCPRAAGLLAGNTGVCHRCGSWYCCNHVPLYGDR